MYAKCIKNQVKKKQIYKKTKQFFAPLFENILKIAFFLSYFLHVVRKM
jgi:hypothetical protein